MLFIRTSWQSLSVFALSLFLLPVVTQAQHYKQTNLVSDIQGMAPTFDPNLKNPWGLTRSSSSPFWVGNNNSGTSTLYDGQGNPFPPKQNGGPLVVTVPPPGFAPGTQSAPTGVDFNGRPTDFLLAPAGPWADHLWPLTQNRPLPATIPSAAMALAPSNCSPPPASTSATSSTATGSTLPGVSYGPRAILASSATPFSSAISAADGSRRSTASPTSSSSS